MNSLITDIHLLLLETVSTRTVLQSLKRSKHIVLLSPNGTEFSDQESIELSLINGERLSNVFFCDPNASWQKGSIEKNHEYIRYVFPKGTSFAGLTQEDCHLLASHINSVPRKSLNNQSPFEAGKGFIGINNINKLGISQIPYDDINLSIRLLRK